MRAAAPRPSLPPLAVTMSEAAGMIGISTALLYRRIQRGEISIPIIHIGRAARIRVADIERFIAQQV